MNNLDELTEVATSRILCIKKVFSMKKKRLKKILILIAVLTFIWYLFQRNSYQSQSGSNQKIETNKLDIVSFNLSSDQLQNDIKTLLSQHRVDQKLQVNDPSIKHVESNARETPASDKKFLIVEYTNVKFLDPLN